MRIRQVRVARERPGRAADCNWSSGLTNYSCGTLGRLSHGAQEKNQCLRVICTVGRTNGRLSGDESNPTFLKTRASRLRASMDPFTSSPLLRGIMAPRPMGVHECPGPSRETPSTLTASPIGRSCP